MLELGFDEVSIEHCWVLKRTLELTLALGNILNAGQTQGQADGFAFEGITKILTIKDKDGRSAARFLCEIMAEEEPSCIAFKQNLHHFYQTK